MKELKDIIKRVIPILDNNNIPYVIVGGIAAILKGSPRTTTDIDIIINIDYSKDKEVIINLIKELKHAEFDVLENQLYLALKEGFNTSIYDKKSTLRIDLKKAKLMDEFEVLNHSKQENYEGINIKLASIEQILYGKILYLGDISDVKEDELLNFNDVLDFIRVLQNHPTTDLKWLESKISQINLNKTYQRLLKLMD